MGERLVLMLLSGAAGVLIGLFAPSVLPFAQEARQAEQAWLNPPTRGPAPTPFTLLTSRPTAAQTAVPPTLQPPSSQPTSTPEPPPPTRSFVIALEGGGEMTVNATDHAAAINNVRGTGAIPAD